MYTNHISFNPHHYRYVGRMQPLPAWVTSGPIVGYEGGTAAVLALNALLRSVNITPAAFWLQDWTGIRIDTFGMLVMLVKV